MITDPEPGWSVGEGRSTISSTRGVGTVTTLLVAGFSGAASCANELP